MYTSTIGVKLKKLSTLIFLISFASSSYGFFWSADFVAGDDFSSSSVLRGVQATKEKCNVENTVWTGTECIKFWSHGLTRTTGRVIVFFDGDVLSDNRVSERYTKLTTEKLNHRAKTWSTKLDAPYIYIGRPGTHGSSGSHHRRRTAEESMIISKALDQLKERYGITELVLAGQSGGGHVTASLLTLRSDIVCAVPSSSPNSPKVRYTGMGRSIDITNLESYEPIEHFTNTVHDKLRVIILGDPLDSTVSWNSQIVLAQALQTKNIPFIIVEGQASGSAKHKLSDSGRVLAGLCYHNKSLNDIQNHLSKNNIKG